MRKILIIALSLLFVIKIYPQINNSRFYYLSELINKKVNEVLGDSVIVGAILEIDSVIVDKYNFNDFTDPYNTLKGCVLFNVKDSTNYEDYFEGNRYNTTTWVGVFKSNEIIWLSQPSMYEGPLEGKYIRTLDMNNDGKVEIIHEWDHLNMRVGIDKMYLQIIEWDGQEGTFINDGGVQTKLVNENNDTFDVIDLDGDVYFEIVTNGRVYNKTLMKYDSSKIIYCWNGYSYGIWDICSNWPDKANNPYYPFTKANDFSMNLSSDVVKNNDSLFYRINIKNSIKSKQNITQIFFKRFVDSLYYEEPLNWGITIAVNNTYLGLVAIDDTLKILLGNNETFIFKHSGLPQITNCYVLSDYKLLDINDIDMSDPKKYWQYRDDNIINNSVKGFIITPSTKFEQLNENIMIDFLTTYTDSSYALGWIKDKQTRDKYDNYFSTAKTYLEQGDSSAARAELQKVLTDCNTDSSTVLTSEAYALLYFNTEYLVNKLPEGEPFPQNDIDAKVKAKVIKKKNGN